MFLWQPQALHLSGVFRRRVNYTLAYKTLWGREKDLAAAMMSVPPSPTSHALESSDETLTLEEGREGTGNDEEGSLSQGAPALAAPFSSGRVGSGCVCVWGGVSAGGGQ